MAAANAPVTTREVTSLPSLGIGPQFIGFAYVTMESERYICVRETSPQNSVTIIDMTLPKQPLRRPITADSALMNPLGNILALKAQDQLQIFNIETKTKIKTYQMPEQIVFWKWITPKTLGLVTQDLVYHWSIEGASEPVKVFERTANLTGHQIINYRCDPSEKWLVLIGIAPGSPERPQLVKGNMQLYSIEQKRSQSLEAHAAAFGSFKVSGNDTVSALISFAAKCFAGGQLVSKLHVIELGAQTGKVGYAKKQAELFFPPDFADDFPISIQISQKYGLIYVISKMGLLFVYDLETAAAIYRNRISPDALFLTVDAPTTGGFYAVNKRGQVLLSTVNDATVIPFISGQLKNLELAVNLAKRANLPGAENLVIQRFQELISLAKYREAADLAAESPQGVLRTPETVAKLQLIPVTSGQTSPLLQYFGTLLTRGKLNAIESLELSRLVVSQNKKHLLENWLAEDKLECTEDLGDLIRAVDVEMALKVYIKARATPKVIAGFAERREFEKILIYSKQVGYMPDYLYLLQSVLAADPQAAVKFALMLSKMEGGCPLDYNTIIDLFLQRNMIRETTAFLLDVLKPNAPEHAMLQTKVLEINLLTFPNVADAIMANGMFSHYDRSRIAQLCEKAGLYMRALQHYTELADIKRVIVNTHALDPQALLEFFGSLSRNWALDCMKELLLIDIRANLQIVVQVAKDYAEQIGTDSCINLFEQFRCYEGLYFFLGAHIISSEDPNLHFKYIEAAAKVGQLKEVERVTRESSYYDAEKTKNFLMEANLPDARPLINVCDRFEFISDLTHHLYSNNMLRYIEGYVQKVNPGNAPLVVGQLLEDDCQEEFIRSLIFSIRSLIPVEPLVNECQKRNRLKLLSPFLENLVAEGSKDVHVHSALAKIAVDTSNNPEQFLITNPYYDFRVVGKYCENRDPTLAVIAYQRGHCDDDLVHVTNRNSLFKIQARYVVERMDADLWGKLLTADNFYRRQFIDQVVSTALPESKSPDQVSVAVKAFMIPDLSHELIELLEKLVLQNSAFRDNPNLQNLLILTAIKADKSRVMDYVNRLDNFDGPAVGEIAVGAELYEEAFTVFKKFNLNVQAVNVLLDNIQDIERGVEFANRVEEGEVWSQVAKSQLRGGLVIDAIDLFMRANDTTHFTEVITAAEQVKAYDDLVRYLLMVRKTIKEPKVDSELIYAYAMAGRTGEIEDFLVQPHVANLQNVGDRLFDTRDYEAARIIFTHISSWGRLASTLIKLKLFQEAVDAARRANNSRIWKEVCFACVDAEEFRLAQICGLNVIVQVDDLEEVSSYYQKHGRFNELIALMESGLGLERAHMGIFTELGVLYAKYHPDKLMEHLKLFVARVNIPKLIRVCNEQQHWKELTYLYIQYDEFDNAAATMMSHSPEAWDHMEFSDVAVKVAKVELYYKAVNFYLQEHPDLLNDLLHVLATRIDHSHVVDMMRKAGHLALIKPYMVSVQSNNINAVNEALNGLYVEEEDFDRLRESIEMYDAFDQISLAQKIEKHELLEFRRTAACIYKKAGRWRQSVALSKKDNLYKDAMETCSESGDRELAEELLEFFVEQGKKECFASCLYTCYDLIRADVALELGWMNNMVDFAVPYLLQFIREYTSKVDELIRDKEEALQQLRSKATADKDMAAKQNMYAQLVPLSLPAPGSMPPPASYTARTYVQTQEQRMDRNGCLQLIQDCKNLSTAKDIHAHIRCCKSGSSDDDIFISNKLIGMYGKCGSVKHARETFESMNTKDFFTWVLMLSAYTRNLCLNEAKCIFDAMPERNLISCTAMLAAYAENGNLEEAKCTFDEMPERNVVSWNSMLDAYARKGHLEEAKLVFDEMPQQNLVSWTSLLAAYARQGHMQEAKQMFDDMPSRDLVSWTSMVAAYAQNGHLEEAKKLFCDMPQRDLVSWTSMLSAYAQNGHVEEAKLMFDEMPRQDLVSCTSLVVAYAQSGHLEEAKQLFNEMPRQDLVSWNSMLAAYAQNGHLEEAKDVFDEMPQRDLVSWTSMLAVYAQNGHLEEAKRMFEKMPQSNLVAWTSMLAAYAQNEQLEESRRMFSEMPESNLVAWNAMLAAYAQNGHLEGAKQMFDEIPQRNLVTHNSMLAAYARSGHLEEAKQMFDEMLERNLVSWNSMLGTYAQNGHMEEAKQMFDKMPQRNLVTHNSMLAAYAQKGHLEKTQQMFDEMPQQNLVSWNSMLATYARCGHLEEAKQMFDKMPERDLVSWTAMLASYVSNGHLEEVKHMFDQIPQQNLVSWNSMLAAYSQNGHEERARQLFDRMPKWDILSWTAMLASYAHSGHFEDAIDVFDLMKMLDVPDEVSFVLILIACSHEGEVYVGRSCFVSMRLDYGMEPTKQHYSCMVDLLGRAGYLDDAEDLIASMPFLADIVDWTCFLSACKSHNDPEHGARAAKCVIDFNPESGAAYALLANIYSTTRFDTSKQRSWASKSL